VNFLAYRGKKGKINVEMLGRRGARKLIVPGPRSTGASPDK